MFSNDNVQTSLDRINRNCWDCDNVAVSGRYSTCVCDMSVRRRKKRREKQRFRREIREGKYDY